MLEQYYGMLVQLALSYAPLVAPLTWVFFAAVAWSAVRSLKGIHRELARINAASAAREGPRMTGPLGI